jgi:predicted RNA-binding protein with PUA-like domain
MSAVKQYWLMKSEPQVFSIDDLARAGTTHWDGVRNYQARNFMRDQMRVGDGVLFYHSNADVPGVAGIARVCRAGYPDHTALDRRDAHYDPKATKDNPIWAMVDVEFVEKFPRVVSLQELRDHPKLQAMLVTKRGQRLSVQPVDAEHFKIVKQMAKK